MYNIKLIAFDLDGTLLKSDKSLPPENSVALERAAEMGLIIVPATGRFFEGIPSCVKDLPFLRYAITVNGANVWDSTRKQTIYQAEIPYARAAEIMTELDALPVIYDCYMENWGYMARKHYEQANKYAASIHSLRMIRDFRTPVDDLKSFIIHEKKNVQKIQMFFQDMDARSRAMSELKKRLYDEEVTSSIVNNIEINSVGATKGAALAALAMHLGISLAQTIAFGDDLNDISLLKTAGIGVAMGNAPKEVQNAADMVAGSCDEAGFAQIINNLVTLARD